MSRITRRKFVGQSLAVTGALAFAPQLTMSAAPNEKMGVAIVGAGGRGGSHIGHYISDPRTDIIYIVDVDEAKGNSRADAIAKQQGFRPKVIKDMRRALDDKAVTTVSTATPNHWHALCGVWAMQSGKDVYIEKPVCHNIWEGAALVAAARKYDRIAQVGTQSRSNPAVRDAVAFIASGGIGECNFARGLCYKRRKSIGDKGDYPVPGAVDFNLWSGPAQYTEPKVTRGRFHYDWHWQRNYGNGDLGNQGPHQTDIARWGLGLDRHPSTILSYGGRLGYQAERKNDKYVDAGDTANTEVSVYDYGDKCIVFETRGLDVSNSDDTELNKVFGSTKGNKIGVVFYGSEGYVVQRTYGHCVAYDKDMKVIKEFKGGSDNLHFNNFLEACQKRDRNHLNAEVREGHLSAAISHLGNISYYLGEENKVATSEIETALKGIKSLDNNMETLDRTVKHLKKNGVDLDKYPISLGSTLKFDPEKETFAGNDKANELLTRDYRDGFVCPLAKDV
ncbi:MAG: putative dehydrogenase [Pirellulaceae bacterium]|jgi:predicted dehydrogenase